MAEHLKDIIPDPFTPEPITFDRSPQPSTALVGVASARLQRLLAIEKSHTELAETLTGIVAVIQVNANDERGLNRRLVEDYLGEAIHRLGIARRLTK